MYRVLKDGGFAVSFYGWNKVDLFMDAWKAAGFRVIGHLEFRKSYASSARFLRYEHEQAYLLAKGNPRRPARPIPDVLDFPYSGNRLHPTQKPVEALAPLIEAFTKPGELVLDPFSGSGSTLAAAQELGRDWTGIELDNGHYHTASKRLYDARGFLCFEGRCGDIDADWWHGFEPLIFAWNAHVRCRRLTYRRADSGAEWRSFGPCPAG